MRLIGNILWLLFAGLWLAIAFVVAGVVTCITIIGIPWGIQSFKLASYVLWPFGSVVVRQEATSGVLTLLGNIIWLLLGGIWLALSCVLLGLLFCITIVGIPFGVVLFRMAGLALLPFGKVVVPRAEVPAGAVVYIAAPEGRRTA